MDMTADDMTPDERLQEWVTFSGQTWVNSYSDTSVIFRMMEEGPGSGSSTKKGNGPVPHIVIQQEAMLNVEKRCREIQELVEIMPDDWKKVVMVGWIEGKGYRRAQAVYGWPERKWIQYRGMVLGWLEGRLQRRRASLIETPSKPPGRQKKRQSRTEKRPIQSYSAGKS